MHRFFVMTLPVGSVGVHLRCLESSPFAASPPYLLTASMKFLIARSAWHPISLLAVLSLWIGTVGNLPFWLAIWRLPETQGLRALSTMGSLWLILVCLLLWFLCLWVWPRWLKPAAVVMLITVTSSCPLNTSDPAGEQKRLDTRCVSHHSKTIKQSGKK